MFEFKWILRKVANYVLILSIMLNIVVLFFFLLKDYGEKTEIENIINTAKFTVPGTMISYLILKILGKE